VKRVIARHEAGGGTPARSPRERNYDGVAVLVAERVGRTGSRISAERLLPTAGYAGSPRNFRRLVEAEAAVARRASPWPPSGGVVTW
jgi:hypothetical protein